DGGGRRPGSEAIRSVECYDFEEQRWYQVADSPLGGAGQVGNPQQG
ncbi:unnamed protein product, partial [Tetraodon nigroviridis]